jgi:hypothetical protein
MAIITTGTEAVMVGAQWTTFIARTWADGKTMTLSFYQ